MTKITEDFQAEVAFTVPFTQVQNAVIDCLGFDNPIDKMVYISLLRFGFQKGNAFPSINKLAMMNNSSENRIRSSIKRLVAMKLVKITERVNADGGNSSNLYTIYDLSNEMKENTITNREAVINFKEEEKRRKEEKYKKTLEKKQQKIAPSKNEVGRVQKLKDGASKNEGVSSEIEAEEYLSNNKSLRKRTINNLSIYEREIEKAELPLEIKVTLKKMMDGLIFHAIDLKDIVRNYNAYADSINSYKYAIVLETVLSVSAYKIKKFNVYMGTAIKNELSGYTNGSEGQIEQEDNTPEWFKNGEHLKKPDNVELDIVDMEEKEKLDNLMKQYGLSN